ncbi:MAG: hypothetical protein C0596_17210 [Marinilabiliales bacterium]|nr:MAG: hypothetical protein C0596_17210 [Marinilabiliales bacterium]
MNLYKLFVIIMILYPAFLFADNDIERKDYDWETEPLLTEIEISYTNISACVLKSFVSKEFIFDENDNLYEYVLIHKKIKLLTNSGIEDFNRVYLSVNEDKNIVFEKARVINSNGKVIELNQDDIKEGVDEETQREYRYFAFDGIDINSEIEYIYMLKNVPNVSGSLIDVQEDIPQRDYTFELISPFGLIFDFKSFNGLQEVQADSSLYYTKEKNKWVLEIDEIKELPYFISSAYDAELMYFGYKLSENLYTDVTDMYSYIELSELINEFYFESIDKNDLKFLKKISKKIQLKDLNEEQKIRAIEEYVKSNISIFENSVTNNIPLSESWEMKIANEVVATKILANLYRLLDVDVEIGLTCDRFVMKFDSEFELWSFANDYILYFPSIDKYTCPTNFDRLGFPNNTYITNNGLFVKIIEVAGQNYGLGSVKEIPVNDYRQTGDTLLVNVDLQKTGFSDIEIEIYHSVSGYKADVYQMYYDLIKEEEFQKEIKESLLTYIDDAGEVKEIEIKNFDSESFGIKPAIAEGILLSDSFFEKAEDKYLFQIGELIGPQMEMYEEEERTIPVEDPYARHYYRELYFTIPDGYVVKNLEDLVIDEKYIGTDNDVKMLFTSKYQQEGNKVTVIIEELYKICYFPLDIYENYRSVVNSAADFNKIVLVFEKQ